MRVRRTLSLILVCVLALLSPVTVLAEEAPLHSILTSQNNMVTVSDEDMVVSSDSEEEDTQKQQVSEDLVDKISLSEDELIDESLSENEIVTGGDDELSIKYSIYDPSSSVSNDEYIKIMGWEEETEHLNIPLSINNIPVRTIENRAFQNSELLTSVSINAELTDIGIYAFSECQNLKSVSINGAKTIGNYAFNCCYELESVSMGSVTETIGSCCFYMDEKLSNINLAQSQILWDKGFLT